MRQKLKKIGIALLLLGGSYFFVAFKTDYFEVAKQIEIFTTLFKEINMYYIDETNPAELTEKAIESMLNELDPYTKFYDEQGVEDVRMNAAGEYSGIGATTKYMQKRLVLYELYKDFPAEKAGLKVGDEIIFVNDLKVTEENINEIAALLRGSEGTSVNLTVLRQKKQYKFSVERTKIEVEPVPHYQMIDDKIGYISFDKFNSKASSSVKKAFEDLKSQGMEKLIFDLRDNPGGLLNEAVDITNFFIPKNEIVVKTEAKMQKWSETYKTNNEPIDLQIPIVVLIDKNSASAAEIVAGSLQDLDRAVILGERSFGKGLVQRYRNLSYGTKLKITISKYYTPSGRNIQELDYSHRTKNDIPKFSKENRNAFKTKNGRVVYDGGGIEPDIKIGDAETTHAAKALFSSDLIFDYATEYYYAHPGIDSPEKFTFKEQDFQSFLGYLKKHPDAYRTRSEEVFNAGMEAATEEKYNSSINTEYKVLMQKMEEAKMKEISENKDEISRQVSDEIINRYYYKKGVYENHIYHSDYILKAAEILRDQDRYRQILQGR
jgi:carboxyl-terminal processing protease